MKNKIIPGILKSYSGNYAVVTLPQFSEKTEIEEVQVLRKNINSKDKPQVDDSVLIVFDDYGDSYVLGSLTNEAQPDTSGNDKDIVLDNGVISLSLYNDGKFEVKNQTNELIAIIDELLTKLIVSTTATAVGAQSLSIALDGSLATIQAKIATFKK